MVINLIIIIALYILGFLISAFIILESVRKQNNLKDYKPTLKKWEELDDKTRAKLTLLIYGSWFTVIFVIIREIYNSIKILLK